MIKCISAIYCKLAEPSLSNHGLSSPMSSLSSISEFSPGEQYAMCSPGFRNNSSFDRLDNPFLVEGLKDFSGPYSTMIEISRICGDPQKLHDVKSLLENFRSAYVYLGISITNLFPSAFLLSYSLRFCRRVMF